MAKVQLLYFAWVRETIGKSSEVVTLPPEVTSVSSLISWLMKQDDCYKMALAEERKIRIAVDQDYVERDYILDNPKEIAFFPPVTGG